MQCSNSFPRPYLRPMSPLHRPFLPMNNTNKNSNPMKIHSFQTWVFLPFVIISVTFNPCHAKQEHHISEVLRINQLHNTTRPWWTHPSTFHETHLKLTAPLVLAGALCFLAASISSAGGIGGGGLFIPILTVVGGLDLKTASSFSALLVTGGSTANVVCNTFFTSKKFGGRPPIDYDIALLSEPCMLLGVSIGVVCNLMFPEWLITILFVVFLAWTTFKTCKSGILHWKFESDYRNKKNSTNEPLLGEEEIKLGTPWMKLGLLVIIWFSFLLLHIFRGNQYGQSIVTKIEPCGVGYWIISALQIPLAILFTTWILYGSEKLHDQTPGQQTQGDRTGGRPQNKYTFPTMALLAGTLGGMFGIGGGMLTSPLLLQVGVAPEVTAATSSFMVFFSSTMSAIQYAMLGMEHTNVALIFAMICFIASVIGLIVVQKAIEKHGRASLIVFSVSIVMALSTIMMTGHGALDVWSDYTSGKNMGFKQLC